MKVAAEEPSSPQALLPQRPRRMLAPAAYSEAAFPSLRLARSSRLARRIGKVLLVVLVVATFVVAIAPWQQSIKGSGTVIAFAPFERQQTIQTPIKGRIVRLGDNIVENGFVRKGDLIVEVADIDPGYLGRLESQLDASQRQVAAAETLWRASERNRDAAMMVVSSIEAQVKAYELVKKQVVAAADADVESARNKIQAEQQQLAEQQAALAQVQADFDRQRMLYDEKIASQSKFQSAQRKLKEAQAKVEKSKAYVRAAQSELESKQSDRQAKEQKAQVDIDYATATLRKATADIAKSESEVAKAESDLTKSQKDLLDSETKVARQRRQEILAPFDGYLTRITANQNSQVLKEGGVICTIVPDTTDRAVQIWLDGNDAPLVEAGRHVRLQFEGWPAIQFSGWPAVAVGTFGGQVVSVDATDDGKGKFRILVQPEESGQQWPSDRFLRQGVRTNGWVLLERVPLWYEIWRNMNGFPPVVSTEEPKNSKPPKLPKP
ncbi:HlyD family secretion protein [Rosistilla oblonga]|uniref:HlyD family secretion protein n=1 Tax=Rosistilla oblonga TaxID=2527990 RepID=UPI003A982D43